MRPKLIPTVRAFAGALLFGKNPPFPKRLTDIVSSLGDGTVSASEFSDGRTAVIFAHQDDDLLWMLPFWKNANAFICAALPASRSHLKLVNSIGYSYVYHWSALWGGVSDQEFASTYLDPCRRLQYINYELIKARLRSIISRPDIVRIVTHNNWGEYGHIHHRWVNRAVRELAQEYHKDVWAISIRASLDNTGHYVETGTLGIRDFIYGNFDHREFSALRGAYQKIILGAPMWGNKNHSIWTWGSGEFDYPFRSRLFLRLVHDGIDYTEQNIAIRELEKDVAEFGNCKAQMS